MVSVPMTIKILVTVGSLLVGLASYYIFKKEDNALEEVAEEVIKQQTNWDIDLTLQTKERNK